MIQDGGWVVLGLYQKPVTAKPCSRNCLMLYVLQGPQQMCNRRRLPSPGRGAGATSGWGLRDTTYANWMTKGVSLTSVALPSANIRCAFAREQGERG
jgi:hypothetical protein